MAEPSALPERHSRYRFVVLAMLLLVYILNFLDRHILGILAVPIQADLGLNDRQMGALGGTAVALFYSTLALPLAWLADRTSRTAVITASLSIWSGFTALSGCAGSFWQLLVCRLGVGLGEAGGVAPSHAVITASFPPSEQSRALAVFSLGIPLGSAAALMLGGYVAHRFSWRAALIGIGLVGLVLAPVFRVLVREPPRSNRARPAQTSTGAFAIMASKPSFWLLSFGSALGSLVGYGAGFWIPTLLQRSFGVGLADAGLIFGALILIGGTIGVMAGGWLGDWLGSRDKAAYAWIPAISYLVGFPFYLCAILAPSVTLAFLFAIVPQLLASARHGPILTAIQHLVPADRRSTASAAFLFISNLIGLGLGAWVVGMLSDALASVYGTEALRYAIAFMICLYPVAGLVIHRSAAALRRDWEE